MTCRALTDQERSEGWVEAGFWPHEELGLGAPRSGEYMHLGDAWYAYRGPKAAQFEGTRHPESVGHTGAVS